MAFAALVAIMLAIWLLVFVFDRIRSVWQVVSGWFLELLASLDGYDKYDFLGRPVATPHEKAAIEMDRLIKELHKIMYCVTVINNPPLTDKKIKERFTALAEIERKNPRLIKWYSPTQVAGFSEEKAKAAYGENNWLTVKNTLNLSVVTAKTDEEFFQSIVDQR